MRRPASIRARLTLAVGAVTAVFLGAATFLFSTRASHVVIEGVKADQVATSAELVAAPLAPRAREVYDALQQAGKLAEFWSTLGRPTPPADATIVIRDDSPLPGLSTPGEAPPEVTIAGSVGGGQVELTAATVVGLGELLLSGLKPGDVLVIDNGSAAPAGAASPTGAVTDVPAGIEPRTGIDLPAGGKSVAVDVVTAIPVGNVRNSVAKIRRDLWLASALLTLLAAGTTWLLTGRALRPVEAISRRVDEIGGAGSGERVPEPATKDEIGHLARTVNTMLARLDRAADTQRRFVADASHELRSPLAVIRTESEVALAHPSGTDWPAVVRNVLGETNRLERLVTDLLVLARDDAGGSNHGRLAGEADSGAESVRRDAVARCDVDEVVLNEAVRHRRVPVDTSGVLAGRVVAQPADIARIVRHLLDNAARHADAAVQVSVRPDDSGEHVVLTVDDDGDGVAEADRARIFERFARLQESRSRDAGGAGLGLAVVASLVDALGGSVAVGESPAGGARFTVRLPAAGEA